ncbi:AfsR/SARP family transcriptional regulator [Nocardiopsis alkaliphila]|uniref:AfsR/SARP family transcriptional regulator n=1 Tax=Nocardiopsis alkaliphila TaxID=225762 RepID=UPI000477257E|nr:AfsR/SARP family transcriptional regulator [Nocardiopsis alkaliphila]
MEIRVLGPLEANINGKPFLPTAGKPRQVLSTLALNPNQVITASTLMEELWGTELPRSALTTLQTYILQIRRHLGSALDQRSELSPKSVLVTQHGGYRLNIDPSAVDVRGYEQLVAKGLGSAEAGKDVQASELFDRALDMWRGAALVDVGKGPILEIEAMRLQESRLSTLEHRIKADLRLGRHAELLTELTALTARHPLHEGLHAHHIVAMCRSGRQWQALEIYQALRDRFIDELGLEPSPRLRRLHQAVLASDPALDIMPKPRREEAEPHLAF